MNFLYFEALLSTTDKDVKKLESFVFGTADSPAMLDIELRTYLQIISRNLTLHKEISETLSLYTATFLRPNTEENRTFIELVTIAKKFFPDLDGPRTISTLLGAGFIHALSSNNREAVIFNEENLIGKPRYEIIFQVKSLLGRFILQLELTTGIHVTMDENVKTLIGVLLQTLVNHGTLRSKTRFVAKNKSDVFVGGLTIAQFLHSQIDLKLLTTPSQIMYIHKSFYFCTQHYSTLQPVFRANMAARKTPKFASMEFLEQLVNMKLYINERLLDKIIQIVGNHYDLNLTNPEALTKKLQTLKKAMVGNVQSQKQYQKYYRLQYLQFLKEFRSYYVTGIYFKYYFDFRGRVYADSPISYTFNKTTRCLYYYGFYTEKEILRFGEVLPDVSEIIHRLILPHTNLLAKYSTINFTHKVVQYYLYVIFFELGKLKKNILSLKQRGCVAVHEFIACGVEYYNNPPSNTYDIDEQIEYIALLDILDSLQDHKFIKIPIYKDATASALQLLVLLLGPAEKQVGNEVNFGCGSFWYDTYYGIISRFGNQHTIPDNLQKQYFTRSALKKTIMTHNYQATYLTCLNEFKTQHSLPGDNDDALNKQIIPIFKAFYDYLNLLFNSKKYFAVSSHTLLKGFQTQGEFENQVHFTTCDNLGVPLEYVKLTKQRVERLILAKRETITGLSKSNEIDEIKMFRAIQANIIHSFDGYLVRSVTARLGYPIITIHDSFGIDILHITQLIKITQNELERLIQLDIFDTGHSAKETLKIISPFVLL